MKTHTALLVTIVLALAPPSAQAQSHAFKDNVARMIRKVGVHGNVSFRHPTDTDVTKGTSLGGSIGLSPGRTNGWRYPVGLTMFREHLHSPNGEEFSLVRTRAITAGIGYGWHFGNLSTGVQLQTGLSFNHGSIHGDMPRAFGVPNGAVSVHAGKAVLLKPEVKAEYFLTPKFTLRVSLDYMRLRPDIVVTTPTGQFDDRWDLSNVHANVGIGFYPFRK